MTSELSQAPNFSTSLLDTMRLSAKRRGVIGIIPWSAILLIGAPCLLVWCLKADLRPISGPADLLAFLSGVTAVAGIVAAFSVAAAGQIYGVAGAFPFSDFLRTSGLLDEYLASPQIIFSIQIAIVAFGLFTTLLVLVEWQPWISYPVAVFIGLVIYEMWLTWSIVDLMRRLTWHKADYDLQDYQVTQSRAALGSEA